jgi:hypothetical protein
MLFALTERVPPQHRPGLARQRAHAKSTGPWKLTFTAHVGKPESL